MRTKPILLMLFICLIHLSYFSKNVAVLLNNSKYYYNYRMVSNVLAIYNTLKKLEFSDSDILLGSHQASYNFPANIPANTQRIYDDDLKTSLLTPKMNIDLQYEDVSLHRHLLAFNGRYEENDPLSKRAIKGNVENYFIYLTGHGGDKYMKIQYLQILFSRHFSDFFEELFVSKKVKRALVISDSCSAGTLFYTTSDKVKAFLLGTSGWDDYSVSEGFDKTIGQPMRDKFSSRFQNLLNKIWKTGQKISFEDFLGQCNKSVIDSTLLTFNYLKTAKKNAFLNDFVEAKKVRREVFSFSQSVQEINDLFFV